MSEPFPVAQVLAKTQLEHLELGQDFHDPISHLPVELASRIFHLCNCVADEAVLVDDEVCMSDQGIHAAIFNPLALGAICHSWRAVAFSTPGLWNAMSMKLSNKKPTFPLTLVQQWLDRSAALPLHICFGVEESFDWRSQESYLFIRDTISVFNAYASRWHALNITLPFEYFQLFRSDASPPLSMLRIASLEAYEWHIPIFDLGVAVLPSPSWLSLYISRSSGLKIDFSNLIHFFALDFLTIDLTQILRDAPRLEVCRIEGVLDNEGVPRSPVPAVVNLFLQKFRVQCQPRAVWNRFTFPSLKSLSIGGKCYGGLWTALRSFIQRSSFPLRSLEMYVQRDQYPELFDTLCILAGLEKLNVWGLHPPRAFFQHTQHAG